MVVGRHWFWWFVPENFISHKTPKNVFTKYILKQNKRSVTQLIGIKIEMIDQYLNKNKTYFEPLS